MSRRSPSSDPMLGGSPRTWPGFLSESSFVLEDSEVESATRAEKGEKEMKRVFGVVLAAAVLTVAGVVWAQVEGEIALTRKMVETERQAIVNENLALSEEHAKIFWPLYREYTNKRAQLGDRATTLLLKYANTYKTMDDATATGLLNELLEIQKQEVELKKEWSGKMGKVLPGLVVARFFQIENKLDAYVRAIAADEVPLMTGGKPVTITPGQ